MKIDVYLVMKAYSARHQVRYYMINANNSSLHYICYFRRGTITTKWPDLLHKVYVQTKLYKSTELNLKTLVNHQMYPDSASCLNEIL